MLLSLITPFKGDISLLAQTLNSYNKFLSISKIDYEILIITAQYKEVLDYIKDLEFLNIKLIEEESFSGIYNAMNIGIKTSQGKYLMFINCGDVITNYLVKFLRHINNINNKYETLFSITVAQKINKKVTIRRIPSRSKYSGLIFNVWWHCSILFPGKTIRDNYYKSEYKCAADYEKILDLLFSKKCRYEAHFLKYPAIFADTCGFSLKNKKLCLKEARKVRNYFYLKSSLLEKILGHVYWILFYIEQFTKKKFIY